jgi:hypothetical protein
MMSGFSFRTALPLFAILSVSLTLSCRNVEILRGFQAKVDPGMRKAERSQLVADAERLNEFRFRASDRSLFRLIFQGGELPSDGVLRYLDERINYIVGSNRDVDALLKVGPRSYRELKSRFMAAADRSAESTREEDARAIVMALNMGTAGWWIHEALGPTQGVSIEFDGQQIPLTSSRVGLIQLGQGYTLDRVHQVERLETLIHEGRHSDCTGGLSQETLILLRLGIAPSGLTCGHAHAECPKGHDLSGIPACDVQPWGAYAIGAIFSIGVSRQCENCSEEERQVAEMSASDSLSRVDPLILDGMLSGAFGPPDMTSQGIITE